MSRTYSMHRGDEKCIHILVGNMKVGSHLGDLDIDGKIIVKWILHK
jgi:hypothetical protein